MPICPINPTMSEAACIERQKQAMDYYNSGIARFQECLHCNQRKGEWEGMASPPKITCWCCERENQFLKKKIDGHPVCGFCAKHLQNAISAGVHPDMAKEEIKVVAWNLNPGRWPEKDLWSWNKATDKKNLTVQEKPQSENVPEERSPPVKKLRAIYIPLATERDQKLLDFIDELAMDHRQSRNQKILSILEDAMIRAIDFGEGKAA